MLNILGVLVDVVGIHDAGEAGTDTQDPQAAVLGIIVCDVGNVIASTTGLRVVPFLAVDCVEIGSHFVQQNLM